MPSASVRSVVAVMPLDFHSKRTACRRSVSVPVHRVADVGAAVLGAGIIVAASILVATNGGMVPAAGLCVQTRTRPRPTAASALSAAIRRYDEGNGTLVVDQRDGAAATGCHSIRRTGRPA